MPRRKRPSYGFKQKYKVPRYQPPEINVDQDHDEAFICHTEDNVLDSERSEMDISMLNTAFCASPSPTSRSEFVDRDVQVGYDCKDMETQTKDSSFLTGTRYERLRHGLVDLPEPYIINKHVEHIEIVSLESIDERTYVTVKITVSASGQAQIYAHGKMLKATHFIWDRLPKVFLDKEDVMKLLDVMSSLTVCDGNPDTDYHDLIQVGSAFSHSDEVYAYREGNFGAEYSSTIRSVLCDLLVEGKKCNSCLKYRNCLKQQKQRRETLLKRDMDFTKSTYKNKDLPRELLLKKLNQQKDQISSLTTKVNTLERQLRKKISHEGVKMNRLEDIEMKELMTLCSNEVQKAYPDANSCPRLFWSQQLKAAETNKFGMRWHPLIIRWCLAIRHKSQAAYDTLRDSGFIKLPSNRTLFDYSHHIKSEIGLKGDVIQLLKEEAVKNDMHHEDWRKYVGILFDEMKVKEDLVYDKVSGELVGYCNLDGVGNSIMDLENTILKRDNSVAKCVLVLMVRGIATALKFPLAAYATHSITADFLYPILWAVISVLEMHLNIRVLFLTCDGASSNRTFFNLHRLPGSENVHFTVNPYDRSRNIYFISDVPHLLKTARNCFSNSHSHKKTRNLWCNGKDISWMHIVRLFEEHCEFNMYNPVPKLSRNHIDLNPFSIMKVNLAAQVLSDSVANSLEDMYDNEMSETVLFVRNMNKFFDILNVRSLQEGRNKRNPNLCPFTSVDDERLSWLNNDFLNYFKCWEQGIQHRQGEFTKKQQKSMILSYQTICGLNTSVKSIAQCVKFMLHSGAKFVLTSVFNQDPLEQHFGHYRQKGGHNRNPTVNEVRHTLTTIRTVGAQALPPKTGNTQVIQEMQVIDNSKLPRRR